MTAICTHRTDNNFILYLDVSDGLWNEMPLSYPQKYNRSHPCQVIGLQRSPMTVIPGKLLTHELAQKI